MTDIRNVAKLIRVMDACATSDGQQATLSYPANISPESAREMVAWLRLVRRKWRRQATRQIVESQP